MTVTNAAKSARRISDRYRRTTGHDPMTAAVVVHAQHAMLDVRWSVRHRRSLTGLPDVRQSNLGELFRHFEVSIDIRGTGILDALDLMRPSDAHARGRTGEAGMFMTMVRPIGLREMRRKTWSEGHELALSRSKVKRTIAVDKQIACCVFTT